MYAGFTQLLGYQKGEVLAHEIFAITKAFPREENYSLTDQIRRSSRSVCSNIAEGYAKRRYPKHFIAKLTDALGENYETQVWLRMACKCKYIDREQYDTLLNRNSEVGKLLTSMIRNPNKFTDNYR